MPITKEDLDPLRDENEWPIEDPSEYAKRIKKSLLPFWPEEVLIEWLYRHARFLNRYWHLGFERFNFHKSRFPTSTMPGEEAFYDPRFFHNFKNIKERARNPHDWLARYMLKNGTWNTPIILLGNEHGEFNDDIGKPLNNPYHLLEGHRRLSFLHGLVEIGNAKDEHDVWVVNIDTK